ncbi:MAG: hypothetical protein IKO36_10125 [Bacteroidaceae bacterium]|nr:hypothetical protein [Bacteroidaceae bacterium]
MANNRLYIRCKGCKETLYLAKNFGSAYYLRDNIETKLGMFFQDHAFCDVETGHHRDGGTFELIDEWGEDE